jgi:argininosuccinate lyase
VYETANAAGLSEEEIAEQIAQFDELREMGMLNDEEYEEAISQLRPPKQSAKQLGLSDADIAEQIAQFDELREMGMLNDEEYEEAISQLRPKRSSTTSTVPAFEFAKNSEEDEAALEFERA